MDVNPLLTALLNVGLLTAVAAVMVAVIRDVLR